MLWFAAWIVFKAWSAHSLHCLEFNSWQLSTDSHFVTWFSCREPPSPRSCSVPGASHPQCLSTTVFEGLAPFLQLRITLLSHFSSRVPPEISWGLQWNCIIVQLLCLLLFLTPPFPRCWSQEQAVVNFLHSDLCLSLSVCFHRIQPETEHCYCCSVTKSCSEHSVC